MICDKSSVAGHPARIMILESPERFREVGEKISFVLDTSGKA